LNKSINFIYADLEYIDQKNHTKICRRWKSGDFDLSKIKLGWMPPHPTIFFRKSLIKNLGLFNLEYQISSDYDFMLRYLLSNDINIGYLPRVITKMRTGGLSNRSLRSIIKKSLEDYKIIQTHKIGGLISLLAKNLRKLPQFFPR
jgi:glycosyltransferase